MKEIKVVTLDWYLKNKVEIPTDVWKYSAMDVAKEICHYNYKKYKYNRGDHYDTWYFMCPEKLFMILYVVYGCYLAEFGLSLFPCTFCRRSESDNTIFITAEDVLKYYKIDYDVRKFYKKDKSYDKYAINKKDKKFIHEIVEMFRSKGFVSSRTFIDLYNLNKPYDYDENENAPSIKDVFSKFINKYTIRVKVKG